MEVDIGDLIRDHQLTGVLIDTNILLLHVVGSADRKRISKFKRTKQFTIGDFDLLQKLLACFSRRVTTPSVLTEVSNFASQLEEPGRANCLNRLAEEIQTLEEQFEPSSELADDEDFCKIGLTDTSIKSVARNHLLVLTDDYQLANRLEFMGTKVLNFNYIREI